jgi:hypothetical protein
VGLTATAGLIPLDRQNAPRLDRPVSWSDWINLALDPPGINSNGSVYCATALKIIQLALDKLAGACIDHREKQTDEIVIIADDFGMKVENAHK